MLLTTKSGFISQAIERAEIAIPAQAASQREIASEIEWAKVLEISPDNYQAEAIAASRSIRLPNNKSEAENLEIIAKVYEAYESLKRQERTLDFEDVLLLTAKEYLLMLKQFNVKQKRRCPVKILILIIHNH